MQIRPLEPEDVKELLRLETALFPYATAAAQALRVNRLWSMGLINGVSGAILVADRGDRRLGGFVEVSLRNVVDGCASTPVGYVEAWYVDEDLRHSGLGRQLVESAERWARSQGCREIGSDCLITNDVSRRAHEAMGYHEVDRCINFRKELAPAPAPTTDAAPARDWIQLSAAPLAAARAVEFVLDAGAGGIDVFLGTTRDETSATGAPLIALDYEAYAEMAVQRLRDLAAEARAEWPIVRLALLHRIGRVRVAEPSVVIAVSCPHRGEAFDACRFLIDSLKVDVPIWKKEIFADGSGAWVSTGEF